jgi:RNA polymerase sigma factor (sigma-70 family)
MTTPSVRRELESRLDLIRVLNDATDAWDELYRLISPRIRLHLLQLGTDFGDLEDCVHEVFWRFFRYSQWGTDWRKLPSYAVLVSYLRVVTTNVAHDLHKQRARMGKPVPGDDILDSVASGPSTADTDAVLDRWKSSLSPEELALLEYRMAGLSLSEMANRLGISYGAAGLRVARLRAKLRQL